jgi:uncharacterized membrane protein YhhN
VWVWVWVWVWQPGGMAGNRRTTAAFLGVAAADVALAAMGRERLRRFTKPLVMPTLLIGRERSTQRALALGGMGDVALLGSSPAAFTAGLGAFLAGHLAWIQALRQRRGTGLVRRYPLLVLPYAAAWAGLNAYLWPHTGRDRYPVIAYSTALAAMAITALDTGRPVTAAGGVLFLTTDSLLALDRFAGVELPRHEGWVMATYVAAQGLLAA